MKTKNFFINENKFINFSFWNDTVGFFIIPTVVIDKKLPISPLTTISRITFCFLKFRFSIDLGKKIKEEDYSWNKNKMDNFISWWRKEIKKPITKEKLEEFILNDDIIRDLLSVNDIDYYYTRQFIFKSYIKYLQQR